MAPHLLSFHGLTCPSHCDLQEVSASHPVTYFLCPDLSLLLWCSGSECPQSLCSCVLTLSLPLWFPVCGCPYSVAFFCILTCPFLCGLQDVSPPHSVTLFLHPEVSLILRPPGSESSYQVAFFIYHLTCPSLCGLESVSNLLSVAFTLCPNMSLLL